MRYLLARDRKAFVQFIERPKIGTGEPEAFSEAWCLTQGELLRQWKSFS